MVSDKMFDDATAVKAIQVGSVDRELALKQLYCDRAVQGILFKYIRDHGGTRVDLEEVLPEAILILVKNVTNGKYAGKSTLKDYLIGIGRNLWMEMLRKREKTVLVEDMGTNNAIEPKLAESDFIAQEAAVQKSRLHTLVHELLEMMSDHCKQILSLYYFEAGIKMQDIAAIKGYTGVQQAKNAALRCREQMRKMIENEQKYMDFINNWL